MPAEVEASRAGWQESRTKRAQVAIIPAIATPLIKLLGATYRWRIDGADHYGHILATGRQPIIAFWHGRILPGMLFFRDRGIVVITSANFDGEWIARIIERFGYGTARGSSSRGGVRALLELKKLMAQGRPTAFPLDGPRGPACVAQPGAVFLAKITGNPVLPFHIEASRAWTARSWDRTQVPKPRSVVGLAIGEPFHVPPDVDDAALEAHRLELESRLAALARRAAELART